MLKKYGYVGGVFLPVLILLVWVMILDVQRSQGQEVEISLRGYDPRDLLSGRYILYELDWDNTNCSQFEDYVCPKDEFERHGRFYVPENRASDLEKAIADNNNKASIVFSYRKGITPLVLRFLINGVSWETVVR